MPDKRLKNLQIERKMKKLLIFILLTHIVLSCDPSCKTCSSDSAYACTSCENSQFENLYIKSCQENQKSELFLGLAVVLTILNLAMLLLGYGVYQNVYENIQILSLISWGYGSQSGAQGLSILNFGYMKNNNFLPSYGAQFIFALTIIGIFMILISAVDRIPYNTIGTLIKRKRIIFPLRVQRLIFNMLIFSALSEACTINKDNKSSTIEVIFAIAALVKQVVFLGIVFYLTNYKKFQIDDPHYYVIVQKLSNCRWYARNNFILSLIVRSFCIVIFVTLFEKPQVAGVIITVVVLVYTVVSVATLRFVKWRYAAFNFASNLLTCASLLCMYGCGVSTIGRDPWLQYQNAYYVLIIFQCSFFLLINLIQIIANSNQIAKQLRSIYHRFIICHKMDEDVELNKYDSGKHREKVTSFRKNLIYGKNLNQRDQEFDANQTF